MFSVIKEQGGKSSGWVVNDWSATGLRADSSLCEVISWCAAELRPRAGGSGLSLVCNRTESLLELVAGQSLVFFRTDSSARTLGGVIFVVFAV